MALLDWLDSRTGWRTGRRHLLEEPIQAGVGWWFVTGSILLMLLTVQFVTGVALAMFYVPAPDHAYDSIRFIMERLTFGHVLRGLHFFGASFIVVAAVIHMLRVVALGSYKKPREVTWITGVFLLLIVLGFALSGYLLPWDQKAYWATTVTINIARSVPFAGDFFAGLLRGGSDLGALTLVRWYAMHVFLLPAAVIGFTKTVAREYASRNVTVNAVAPGFIDTAMTQGLAAEVKEALQKQIPLARLGTPADIANAVRFLVSEDASYITGHVLHVNGGMLMS